MTVSTSYPPLRGPFSFLQPELDEIREIISDSERKIPVPLRVFLEDENATPVVGFPVLITEEVKELRVALVEYVRAEEAVQIAQLRKEPPDFRAHSEAWERYAALLRRATENACLSSFGRRYSSVFWLFHSIAVSRQLKETPKRILRAELRKGRFEAPKIKYRIFERYLDRVLGLTYDIAHNAASELDEDETRLFPAILERMRDNVLLLTEDHIGPDLAELNNYFEGHLGIDGRDFRTRFEALQTWHIEELKQKRDLRVAVSQLLQLDPIAMGNELLKRPGYLFVLANRPNYDTKTLLSEEQIAVWERLIQKLKEFELLGALRRLILPVRREEEVLVATDPRPAVDHRAKELRLSSSTRPLDFMVPWVVDPQVQRFGLIYDISDFSEIVSVLKRTGTSSQDLSFRQILGFQRAINRIALRYRLTLEKYLGDGALYSGRDPYRLLYAAIHQQRHYRRALLEDFPFDRGMRIALNFGKYRLLPMQDSAADSGFRYEFFGHGIVELSRLTSGKTMRDIDEMKTLLLSLGYPHDHVDRFFGPLSEVNVDLLDRREESRQFHAYINQNGALINEGIVATEEFIEELENRDRYGELRRLTADHRRYVVFVGEDRGLKMAIGVRKLGRASFKGLGRLTIYELVDLDVGHFAGLDLLEEKLLTKALDAEYDQATGRSLLGDTTATERKPGERRQDV